MQTLHAAPSAPILPLASFADLEAYLDGLGLFRMQPANAADVDALLDAAAYAACAAE